MAYFNYGSGANAENPYLQYFNRNSPTVENPYLRTGALARMTEDYNKQGQPLVNRLTQQVSQGLDTTKIANTMRNLAADRAAQQKAANVRAGSEAGLSGAERAGIVSSGNLGMADALRQADLEAENVAAQRRAEASNLAAWLRNPAEQYGQIQAQSGENVANRNFQSDQNLMNRMYGAGEGAAQRTMQMGENEAQRRLQGMQNVLQFGPAPAVGAGAASLFGGAGGDVAALQPALDDWLTNQEAMVQAINDLYKGVGNYYNSLTGSMNNPAPVDNTPVVLNPADLPGPRLDGSGGGLIANPGSIAANVYGPESGRKIDATGKPVAQQPIITTGTGAVKVDGQTLATLNPNPQPGEIGSAEKPIAAASFTSRYSTGGVLGQDSVSFNVIPQKGQYIDMGDGSKWVVDSAVADDSGVLTRFMGGTKSQYVWLRNPESGYRVKFWARDVQPQ